MNARFLTLLLLTLPCKLYAQGGYVGYVSTADCGKVTIERQGHTVTCNGPTPLYINDQLSFDRAAGNLVQRLNLRGDVNVDSAGRVFILNLKPKAEGGFLDGLKECVQYIKSAWFEKDFVESNSATRGFGSGSNAARAQELFPSNGSSASLRDTIPLRWTSGKYTKLIVKRGNHSIERFDVHEIDSLPLSLEPLGVHENETLLLDFTGDRDTASILLRILPNRCNTKIQGALTQNVREGDIDPHLQKALLFQAISDASCGDVDLFWKSYEELRRFAASGDLDTPLYRTLLDRYFSYVSNGSKLP